MPKYTYYYAEELEVQIIRQQLQQERDQAHERERESQLNQPLRQLQQERDQALRQNRIEQQAKERLLGQVHQQLEANEQAVTRFEGRITELERQLSQREHQMTQASSREKELTRLN